MRGKVVAIGLIAFAAAFGAAMWWSKTRAFYEPMAPAAEVTAAGLTLAVEDFEGIDAPTSPLKMRACFRLTPAAAAALDALAPAPDPRPLVAPGWFECFDAGALTRDLEAGAARAVIAERDAPEGFDRIIAYRPDGRAFMWRQLNERFADERPR
ncbi:DUF6446 family protein [Oceanicella actignis]|uniref:Histidine kinase n=1 Tax=Oceanicella actignis TaxID=1189325 RepID=A0A1M7U2P5_9RHOB|nr:DUF6446 family protein [Oceanicella actignis]TYO84983.1 hypothetical protein LY05_02695 [Oceanicella actignis]SET86615.1 hypothetical protein SAMN04488119_11322 [Oceanicella actignis]SHN77266.1 hypothetical protein SAMN05216200_11510 [Oceanicella actignis]